MNSAVAGQMTHVCFDYVETEWTNAAYVLIANIALLVAPGIERTSIKMPYGRHHSAQWITPAELLAAQFSAIRLVA